MLHAQHFRPHAEACRLILAYSLATGNRMVRLETLGFESQCIFCRRNYPVVQHILNKKAEREGFAARCACYPLGRSDLTRKVDTFRPFGFESQCIFCRRNSPVVQYTLNKKAEREGFEPSAANNDCSGFRDRPVRPLRHLSVWGNYSTGRKKKNKNLFGETKIKMVTLQ